MTNEQSAEMRALLLRRRREVAAEIRDELAASGDEQSIELANRVHDAGDESFAHLLSDLEAVRLDRHVFEYREIDAAVERLDDGSYGECADCGTDIPVERLRVAPAARCCVACQTRREHDATHPGGARA
jgi:RNA polymerase-binding protein DksA